MQNIVKARGPFVKLCGANLKAEPHEAPRRYQNRNTSRMSDQGSRAVL